MAAFSGSRLTLAVPKRFDLPRAVCSYGYFMLAPNRWDQNRQVLERPLRTGVTDAGVAGQDGPLVTVRIMHKKGASGLVMQCDRKVDRAEAVSVKRQVTRMLRLDEDFSDWWKKSKIAKRRGAGCLFRSPTLFEDMVKTITGCNVTWTQTMAMNKLMCARLGGAKDDGFPTPAQFVRCGADKLKPRCKVGYRAERIVRLARAVRDGELDLDWFETTDAPTDEVFKRLKAIYGFGDYAASNVLQLAGRYDRLAIDTETYRHFRQQYDVPTPKDSSGLRKLHQKIETHYAAYAPYQFLQYWFELWFAYEERFGDARDWDSEKDGPNFTASKQKD